MHKSIRNLAKNTMCLIVFAYRAHPDYRLVVAANRDECYKRPAMKVDWWDDHTQILGGRDMKEKGTWMAVHKNGRFTAVTNYRDPKNLKEGTRSRGNLPANFLLGSENGEEYSGRALSDGAKYNGFNLLTMDADDMWHVSNYEHKINRIPHGIHGLSNSLLNDPWPKVVKAKNHFAEIIRQHFELENLIYMMQDADLADDKDLPSTGVSYTWEKALSAMCVRTRDYGTRCSTAVTVDYNDNVKFLEHSYPVGNQKNESRMYAFKAGK